MLWILLRNFFYKNFEVNLYWQMRHLRHYQKKKCCKNLYVYLSHTLFILHYQYIYIAIPTVLNFGLTETSTFHWWSSHEPQHRSETFLIILWSNNNVLKITYHQQHQLVEEQCVLRTVVQHHEATLRNKGKLLLI